jgi:50S ribosomal subunit-associated GTPase HflX
MELKVFIVDVLPSECCKRESMDERMVEMQNLVSTYGGIVVIEYIQRRGTPDYNTYI